MNPLYGYSSLYPAYGDIYSVLGQRLSIGSSSLLSVSAKSQSDAYQLDLSSYGQLMSSLSSFQYALGRISSSSQNNGLNTSSSNSSVAIATASTGAQSASYTLSVNRLATAQTVTSGTFTDASSTVVGSGSMTFSTGTYNAASNSFTGDGSGSTTINITNGSLNSIASAINTSVSGMVASVVQSSDGYRLSIARNITGAENNFKITVADSDGTNTDLSGLSQLAYDPSASAGAGKNLTQTQAAQNAAYQVNGVQSTSSSNTGVKLASYLSANLLQTGYTMISVGSDYSNLSGGAQLLTNAFNTLKSSIGQLLSSSSALQNDAQVSRLISSLDSQAISNLDNGNSTLTTLAQIGVRYAPQVTSNTGETLSLDNNTLQDTYSLDQAGASALLALAAQGFNLLADSYASPLNGSLTQTIGQMQQWGSQIASSSNIAQGSTTPYSLATLLAQITSGVASRSSQLLSAQQVTALAQYSMVLAMSQPIGVRNLQNQMITQIPWLGNSNNISEFA